VEATSFTPLGIPPPEGDFTSVANGVSRDGTVVVGNDNNEEWVTGVRAFRWTSADGMFGLGDLPGGDVDSVAHDVSADGSVIVGSSLSASGTEAFRWTSEDGMVALGDLPGGDFHSVATGVSADGSVVVGSSESASGREAFRWTSEDGMQSVASILTTAAVDLIGFTLRTASDVSADGYTIAGSAVSRDDYHVAWVATFNAFFDAPPIHWAFSHIEIIAANGITTGCGDGNYRPENPVTRARMAVFLERSIRGGDFQPDPGTGNIFLDVPAGYWAGGWIELLSSDGITTGCGNSNYCPEDAVTRAQVAVFLVRAFDLDRRLQ
jgi:probable HAF family extracellular repeat protein